MAPTIRDRQVFTKFLSGVLEDGNYDVIYLCNEEILEVFLAAPWMMNRYALPLSDPSIVQITLSKNATLKLAAEAGVPTPLSLIPENECEVEGAAKYLGWPIVIKGERGAGARNVRIVRNIADCAQAYREIRRREMRYGGRPALQEYIPGNAYSVGGLFSEGRALRICAHRKLLTYPPEGGWTVKGVTERPPGLLEEVLKFYGALGYTGLAHVEFIYDARANRYKFLELNPRVWGSIGILNHAGVDFHTAYRNLVKKLPVKADLSFREGVQWHRWTSEIRLMRVRPGRIFGFIKDSLNPKVKSDIELSDYGPYLASAERWRELVKPDRVTH